MKKYVIFVCFVTLLGCILLTPTAALATAQTPEILVYEGKTENMFTEPKIPVGNPRIRALPQEEFQEKVRNRTFPSIISSTACWRLYIGSWEIKDKRLFLTSIIGLFELSGEEPLFADWFSGVLRVPRGEVLNYVHMGYETVYEETLLISVENGLVVDTNIIDNRL
ncbi:MAG: hypothetical protein FWF87_02175 [Synergistaceae bacterium]|nr:hypothetical protein [Synergistaceae bacterium]